MSKFDRHGLRLLIAALGASVLLAGCVTVPTTPTPAQAAAAAHAQTLYNQGDFAGAAQAYESLADASRGLRDRYLLRAAQTYRQENDWKSAAAVLQRIHRGQLDADQAQHFDLLVGEAALAQGDAARALAATASMTTFPDALQPRVLELRARAQLATHQPLAAARTRLTLDQHLQGFDRDQNTKELLGTLAGMDSATLQQEASTLPANDPLRPWVAQALSRQGSGLARPLPQLNNPVGTVVPGTDQVSTREGYKPPHKIALLLPAGGHMQAAAGAVDDGFITAEHADTQRAATTQVDVFDSGSTPASAIDAYQRAVSNGADIVVGPLGRAAVTALFQQNLTVPMLALNHPDSGVPPPGSAEFSLPPEAEAAQVAARMHAQGLQSAILFTSDASWAQRAGNAFRAQFQSLGGQVLGSATLSPDKVNYGDVITTLTAVAPPNTGIFLALRPEQGRLIVPQLNIAGLQFPVFATSHIYAAESNPGLDRDLDGVQFCDAPWLFGAQPGLPSRSKLEDTQPNAVGPAARLFAFGMDAWALLPYLDWLHSHPGSYVAGATGQLTMDSFGRIQRTPIWAQFVNGIAVPMTGGLQVNDDGATSGSSLGGTNPSGN